MNREHVLGVCFMMCLTFFIDLAATKIAITIDDFPMPNGRLYSFQERTKLLLDACDHHNYKTVFFCIGGACTKEKGALEYLKIVSDQGHFLANHSLTHQHLSSMSLEDFKNEIQQTELILKPYATMRPWFRYPFLDYGEQESRGGSRQKALSAFQIVQKLGYTEGFVSINTFDWHLNARLQQALKRGEKVNYEALKQVYLALLKEWCHYYIDFYKKTFSEDITHTLLLHANDLNARYLRDIIALIRHNGWHLASPEEAFTAMAWRKKVYENPSLLADCKPASLDCKMIDKQLAQHKVFYK